MSIIHKDRAHLRESWQLRHTFPAYRPEVPDDAEEPWSLCLLDLMPVQTSVSVPVRCIARPAKGRAWKQRVRALLPRIDLRGISDGFLP